MQRASLVVQYSHTINLLLIVQLYSCHFIANFTMLLVFEIVFLISVISWIETIGGGRWEVVAGGELKAG